MKVILIAVLVSLAVPGADARRLLTTAEAPAVISSDPAPVGSQLLMGTGAVGVNETSSMQPVQAQVDLPVAAAAAVVAAGPDPGTAAAIAATPVVTNTSQGMSRASALNRISGATEGFKSAKRQGLSPDCPVRSLQYEASCCNSGCRTPYCCHLSHQLGPTQAATARLPAHALRCCCCCSHGNLCSACSRSCAFAHHSSWARPASCYCK
jgi:hypothetical protein